MVEHDTLRLLVTPRPAADEAAGTAPRSTENLLPAPIAGPDAPTDLRSPVSHAFSLPAETPLETAQEFFSTQATEFVAVLDGVRPIGICARRQIGIVLGSRYGFSLFARNPVRNHLLPEALIISVTDTADLKMCWASAGHPCPLLLRPGGGSIVPLALPKDKRGKVLGLINPPSSSLSRIRGARFSPPPPSPPHPS